MFWELSVLFCVLKNKFVSRRNKDPHCSLLPSAPAAQAPARRQKIGESSIFFGVFKKLFTSRRQKRLLKKKRLTAKNRCSFFLYGARRKIGGPNFVFGGKPTICPSRLRGKWLFGPEIREPAIFCGSFIAVMQEDWRTGAMTSAKPLLPITA